MAERRGLIQNCQFVRTFGSIQGIIGNGLSAGPDLSDLTLTTKAYVTEDYHGISFSADGLQLFTSGSSGNDVFVQNLSVAFDISTMGIREVPPNRWDGHSAPEGLFFSPDGTVAVIVDSGLDQVRWAVMSTAFDLTTIGTTQTEDISTETGAATGITFNANGTLMFVGGSQKVFKYVLSTAYDPSTKGAAVEVLDVSAVQTTGGLFGMDFAPDGLKFYSCDITDNVVDQWNLSVAFDLTTAAHQAGQTTAAGTNPYGLHVKRDGSIIWTSHNTTNKVITEWA